MTPAQISTAARRLLNADSDSFWSDTEIEQDLLYFVCLEVSRKTLCYEKQDTSTTTVASTATYTEPTDVIRTKYLVYDSTRVQKINRRQYDSLIGNDTASIGTGTPRYYFEERGTVTLYPTPDAAKTLEWDYYAQHPTITSSSQTLNIQDEFHDVLVMGTVRYMVMKEVGDPRFAFWDEEYQRKLLEMERSWRRRRRGDKLAVVQNEEILVNTDFGIV